MKQALPKIHFVAESLIRVTNPVSINLIGAGGTGSHVLSCLGRMNDTLQALGHAGLFVRLYDDDVVSVFNKGRQLFAPGEVGMPKASALINRMNRFYQTNWKSCIQKFERGSVTDKDTATITISCVDKVAARFAIADILNEWHDERDVRINRPIYWMDFGNGKLTGQAILSTIGEIKQPQSKQYDTIGKLPQVTEEFATALENATDADDLPSCSHAEALGKQDLFINSSLANMGIQIVWDLLRNRCIDRRGLFMSLADSRTTPIKL